LVEQGVLSPSQLRHILAVQRVSHRPFGDLAERMYGVSPEAVEDAWVEQYVASAGVADLEHLPMDSACLHLVSPRQAWQFHVVPMAREEGSLHVATDEEHLLRAVNFATRRLSEPAYFVLGESEQLREMLMRHYPVPAHMAQFAQAM
jgi:hypothetical protein